jgi:hypothetical protein
MMETILHILSKDVGEKPPKKGGGSDETFLPEQRWFASRAIVHGYEARLGPVPPCRRRGAKADAPTR